MITVCVMPNFKGPLKEKLQALAACLFMDGIYILPIIISFLK